MTEIEQEPDVVPKRPIVLALGVALGVIAACVAGTFLMIDWWRAPAHDTGPRTWQTSRAAPFPEDVSDVESADFGLPTAAEQQALDARRRLESYGWVDRAAGRVHVPIDVAIELPSRRAQPSSESP
jgi:hypothetical protein